MKITLNGQKRDFANSCSLSEIVTQFCRQTEAVIAEHNGTIVKSAQWQQTKIREGDILELVTLVGGG
jgi:sulfur carrier protein